MNNSAKITIPMQILYVNIIYKEHFILAPNDVVVLFSSTYFITVYVCE